MSISSIGSSQTFQPQTSSSGKSSSMTSEQQTFIKDLLSQYDSNSLSESDAKEIAKALQEAGIEPSGALQSAMSASGFDAKEIGDLAGVGKGDGGGKPMGPPPPNKEEIASIYDLLDSLLSSKEEDDTTSSITNSSSSSSFSSFNTILDYTSKIVSLKDDAKTQVMDILDKYNLQDNTLSQEDTEKFIINSLNQILKEPDNYNTISFYA